MKKILLLSSLLLVTLPQAKISYASNDIELSSSITNNLTAQLKGALDLEADIDFKYSTQLTSLKIHDQIDSSNRTNIIYYKDKVIQESYLIKNSKGYAEEKYLTISNTTETREIVDSSNNAVKFNVEYGSPFTTLSTLSNEKINSYFSISLNENNYILKAKDYAYGILANPLLTFYYDYDGLIWDDSYTRSIENLVLTLDSNGYLINVNFDKIKKDIFGGIKENYDITVSSIDGSVKTLTPIESSLTESQKNNYQNKITDFQNRINNGNFTQNISLSAESVELDGYSYSSYYALNEDDDNLMQGMICSLPLYDQSHGETYLGMFKVASSETDGNTYSSVGISPDDDFSGTITEYGTTEIKKVIPNIADISIDLFTYNETKDTYIFDFDEFLYDDVHFCSTLLISLFGVVDPLVHNLGLYTYDGSSYYFDTLEIGFDTNNNLYGVLSYSYYGYDFTSTFSFSNVGETNLIGNENISKIVDYLLS